MRGPLRPLRFPYVEFHCRFDASVRRYGPRYAPRTSQNLWKHWLGTAVRPGTAQIPPPRGEKDAIGRSTIRIPQSEIRWVLRPQPSVLPPPSSVLCPLSSALRLSLPSIANRKSK